MRIIVCLDEKGGMSFGGRRQSRDSALCQRILEKTVGDRIWMNAYSARLFPDTHSLCVADDYLQRAAVEDWCFVETDDLTSFVPEIHRMLVYRWNRHYPSDRKLPESLMAGSWHLESRYDFPGSSHDCITEEVYSL